MNRWVVWRPNRDFRIQKISYHYHEVESPVAPGYLPRNLKLHLASVALPNPDPTTDARTVLSRDGHACLVRRVQANGRTAEWTVVRADILQAETERVPLSLPPGATYETDGETTFLPLCRCRMHPRRDDRCQAGWLRVSPMERQPDGVPRFQLYIHDAETLANLTPTPTVLSLPRLAPRGEGATPSVVCAMAGTNRVLVSVVVGPETDLPCGPRRAFYEVALPPLETVLNGASTLPTPIPALTPAPFPWPEEACHVHSCGHNSNVFAFASADSVVVLRRFAPRRDILHAIDAIQGDATHGAELIVEAAPRFMYLARFRPTLDEHDNPAIARISITAVTWMQPGYLLVTWRAVYPDEPVPVAPEFPDDTPNVFRRTPEMILYEERRRTRVIALPLMVENYWATYTHRSLANAPAFRAAVRAMLLLRGPNHGPNPRVYMRGAVPPPPTREAGGWGTLPNEVFEAVVKRLWEQTHL